MSEQKNIIEPYPHDGSIIDRVGWWFAYGPMLFVTLLVGLLLVAAIRFWGMLKRVTGRE